jgi:lipid A ethanolaminephosphotransferase
MFEAQRIPSFHGLRLLTRSTSTTAPLFVAAWCVALCNAAFWSELWKVRGDLTATNLLFLGSVFVVAVLYVNLQLSLLTFRGLGRPVLAFVLLASSVVAYFTSALGARIDPAMLHNVFETNAAESSELVTARLATYFLVLGLLPTLFLLRTRIDYAPLATEIARKLRVAGWSALLAAPIAILFYADFASLMRNHRELRYLVTPTNFLSGTLSYLRERNETRKEIRPIGLDASAQGPSSAEGPHQLLVIVVGETARGANFSLGGYGRETNPELAAEDVLYFTDVRSSGTSTAISLPCMFSNLGRSNFTPRRAKEQEGLLDVLAHAGFEVLWRDNDSGCKGTCDRVEYENLAKSQDPELCSTGECFDEILLSGLQERLDRTTRDLVVVLHMHGSHGPGYHLRYPPAFERFTPTCRTLELGDCSHEELVNAYDNTILYTDHVLAETLALLKRNAARFDTGMIYVSDHGESLGEKGLYLHGMPYWMAPDEQTLVPMIVWTSEGLRRRRDLHWGALASRRTEPCSHDNLFHSVLGLLDVHTSAYRQELDLFSRSAQQ